MICLVVAGSSRSLINFRRELLEDMVKLGNEVHVACADLSSDQDTTEELLKIGVFVHDIKLERNGMNPFSDVKTLISLIKVIKRAKADLILAYTIKPVIWGMLAAKFLRVKHRYALITGLGYAFTESSTIRRSAVQFVAKWLYWVSLKHSHKVFFQNPDDLALFKKLGITNRSAKLVVVNGSGVDTKHFSPTPFPQRPVSFLLVARLLGDKGVREYVEAATLLKSRFPECSFDIVGGQDSNPDSIPLSEVQAWQVKGIVAWHGHTTDVRQFISNCHVFVLPSYREGTPRSVLEAMAMGRPIITSDAPGCRETVIPNINGWLVAVKDSNELASQMEKFICDPSLIAKMGQESRKIAEEKYDVDKVNRHMFSEMGGLHSETAIAKDNGYSSFVE